MTTIADLRAVLDAADSVPSLQSDLVSAKASAAQMAGQVTELTANLAAATADATRLTSDLTASRATVQTLSETVAARDATIVDLRKQIASTTKPVTLWGACPVKGGTSLSEAQTVLDKWGTGRVIRQFNPGAFAAPQHPSGAACVHTSWKPTMADLIAGKLDASLATVIKAMTSGDAAETDHEADKKVRDGKYSLKDAIAAKNRFFDIVTATRSDVIVVTTYTGWLFEPTSGLNPKDWAGVKAHYLGVDLDGIAPKNGVYPDFEAEIALVAKLAKEWGYKGWCVPELGAPRDTTADADGAKRAAWLTKTAALCREAGAKYVCLFEYPTSPNNELTTSAEIKAWQDVMAKA